MSWRSVELRIIRYAEMILKNTNKSEWRKSIKMRIKNEYLETKIVWLGHIFLFLQSKVHISLEMRFHVSIAIVYHRIIRIDFACSHSLCVYICIVTYVYKNNFKYMYFGVCDCILILYIWYIKNNLTKDFCITHWWMYVMIISASFKV